mmetsp:Transcript_1218/g.2217  ORF Transcript_1218/g.2217 Transcript_1218/m.2217 type:complete len:243 (-) Transcript_1218:514-1242(-)
MQHWDGIVDALPNPERTWFCRVKETDPWKPLRKCDCKLINTAMNGGKKKALIEFGRATVDLDENIIRYNFYNVPSKKLCSAVWFMKDYKSEKEVSLIPIISTMDEMLIEGLYLQQTKNKSSSTVGREVLLKDDTGYKVFILNYGGKLSIRKKPTSLISLLEGSTELQRGYDDYKIEGEEEENALGPVKHLSFIVHGIGEAMWRREDVKLPSLIDTVELVRTSVNRKMYDSWKSECQGCQRRR